MRTLQIPFCDPQIGPTTAKKSEEFASLNSILQNTSSMAGLVVSLEETFLNDYQAEYMHHINKRITAIMGHSEPRLTTGYSILLYFTSKVHLVILYCLCVQYNCYTAFGKGS